MSLWAKSTSARFLLFENVVGIVPVRLQHTGGYQKQKLGSQSMPARCDQDLLDQDTAQR